MMLKTIRIVLLLLLFPVIGFSQTTKVLFIGNSYTGVNNLPQFTYDVALSTGDTLIIDSHTPGGQRLLDHVANPQAISKIFSNDWNYVVLQAQSQEPSWPIQQVQTEVFKPAKVLCDTIRANNTCTRPVFYMTWGRKNGDSQNCPNWPPVCTYHGMDSLLRERYQTMGADNDAYVSPVGVVWHYIRINYPQIELYAADESHPSIEGSYAAACTFYTVFLRKDPTLIPHFGPVDPGMAADIQLAVKAMVFDSLSKWNVGKFDPVADFDVVDTSYTGTVNFTNQSVNADSVFWDFGNGTTSTDENPVQFFNPGVYFVKLIAFSCGVSDTLEKTVTILVSGIEEPNKTLNISVYPNPTTGNMSIEIPSDIKIKEVLVFDSHGSLVRTLSGTEKINFQDLVNGLYWLKINTQNQGYWISPIIKE